MNNIITLKNGIVLNPKDFWAESITQYAISKGYGNIVCFVATLTDGKKAYVLVEYLEKDQDGYVIYENPSFEAICAYLDMLWAADNMK